MGFNSRFLFLSNLSSNFVGTSSKIRAPSANSYCTATVMTWPMAKEFYLTSNELEHEM
jgi:hypothetical protein